MSGYRSGETDRKGTRLKVLFIVIAVLTAVSCGTQRRGVAGQEIPETLSEELTRGEQVFFTHCHRCHPGGEGGLGPALNNKPLPRFLIRFQVRNGLGAMPSFPEEIILSDELDALIEYVEFLRAGE